MYFTKKIGIFFLVLSIITGLLYLKPLAKVYAALPFATIVVADDSLTIGETSLVTITFSGAVSGFNNADLTIPNGTLSTVSSSDGGVTWTATFTPTVGITDETNMITLDNTGVQNVEGVGEGTTDSNNFAIDTVRPTATIEVADMSLTAGETTLVTITFSEAVTGFNNADLTISNGTLNAVSSSDGGITWTATFTPAAGIAADTNIIMLNNTGIRDIAGNIGEGTTDSNNYAINTVRSTATIVVADTSLTAGETTLVTITFSEVVEGFNNEDLTIPSGTLSTVSSSDGGVTWTATFTPAAGTADDTNIITLDNTGVQNSAGSAGVGTTDSNNYAINTVRPTATIVVADTSLTTGETTLVTITFSEAVEGFNNEDLTIPNGTLSAVSSSDGGIMWTATFTPQANVREAVNLITLQNSGVNNSAGNAGQGTTKSNPYSVFTVSAANGGGSSTPTAPISPTTPTVPTDHTVTAINGKITLPIGTPGVVSLGKEILISIPAGATPQELKLSIEKVLNTETLLTTKEVLASSVFELLKNFPENFSKPVKLTLTFDPTRVESHHTVAVFYYDEAKKDWVKVEGGILKENQITVEINHFTKFAVLVVDTTTGEPITKEPIDPTTEVSFSDINGHWAGASIEQAVSEGFVTGYPDGTFKPGNTVTRAEFSAMLMHALKSEQAGVELTFTDTAEIGACAKTAVSQAVQAGIINGYEDGTFRPNANLTRAEMATMIAYALNVSVEENTVTSFADDKAIPAWAKGSVAILKELGIVNGMGANTFNPSAETTRAEAIIVLVNMLGSNQ